MPTPEPYEPFAHAEALGIEVAYRPVDSASGLWVPERRMVVLRPGLHRAHERSTLAHELVHAEYRDRGRIELQERRADRFAARRLLDGFDFRRAAALSDDPGAWALEAGVTDHLMGVYLRDRERHGVRSAIVLHAAGSDTAWPLDRNRRRTG